MLPYVHEGSKFVKVPPKTDMVRFSEAMILRYHITFGSTTRFIHNEFQPQYLIVKYFHFDITKISKKIEAN